MQELGTTDRRRVRRLVRELDNSWPDDRFLPRAAQSIANVFGTGHAASLYHRKRDGSLGPIGQTLGRPMDRWSGVRGHHTLPTHFRYSTQAPDRFTNCPVDEDQLYRNDPGELERFRADCLAANGVWHQIRTIIYARREFAGFFGVFRAKGDRPFARREHTLMGALLPHARSWLSAVRLFHQAVDGTAVAGVLDALDEPAFLTTLSGRVVHANPAALHRYPEPPSWLPALARRGAGRSQMATTHRIETDGAELLFIRLRIAEPRIDVGSLPAYLQVVAELMSSGASDKDIAFELDVSVATARTYAGRVLERLGLHDRRQLMRRG